jgi:hypothetical protein
MRNIDAIHTAKEKILEQQTQIADKLTEQVKEFYGGEIVPVFIIGWLQELRYLAKQEGVLEFHLEQARTVENMLDLINRGE